MKPEAINKAIAEYCGWEFVQSHDRNGNAVPERWVFDDMEYFEDVPYPNYYNDLNAMHEAERVLTTQQCCRYESMLQAHAHKDAKFTGFSFHATSQQRAEAFLRTVGKWKE
jgi:hypothetical protein